MAATLANLVVRMSADIANITTSISKAEHQFARFKQNANRILGTIGVGIGAGAFVHFIKGTIDAADALADLRRRTGQTGQELLILQGAAARGGGSLEQISGVVSKLSIRLVEASRGTGDAAAAYQAMGISVKNADGQLKGVDQILREVGERFKGYEDGANKAALANAALGKGGDQLIPVIEAIKETEERYKRLGITIGEDVITAADEFNDTMQDVKDLIGVIGRNLASLLLPHLQRGAELLTEFAKEGAVMRVSLSGIKTAIDAVLLPLKVMATGFITLGGAISYAGEILVGVSTFIDTRFKQQTQALADYFDGLKNFDLSKMLDASKRLASVDFSEPANAFRVAMERANQTLSNTALIVGTIWGDSSGGGTPDNWDLFGPGGNPALRGKRGPAPGIPDLNAQKSANTSLQALLDQRVKLELEALQDLAKKRTALLDLAYDANLVSELDYWREKMAIQKSSFDAELAALETQLKRQQDIASKSAPKSKEYYDAQKDVEATQARINKVTAEFGQLTSSAYYQAQKAADAYRRSIQDIDAQIASLKGNEVEAARLRLQNQNEDLRRKFTVNQDFESLGKLDELERLTLAQTEFNAERQKQSDIGARLAIEEERIQNSLRVGSISEFEALQRTGEARARAAAQLDDIVKKLEEVARASQNPALILQAEQARAELEKLRMETDLLAQKFDTIFRDSFADAFADFIDGSKSAKEAFASFTNSVVRQINRMVAEALSKKLFESLGLGGSVGGLFGGIFGGGSSKTGVYGPTQSGGNIGGGWDDPLAGNVLGTIGRIFGGGGSIFSFDTGTDYVPRDMLALIHKGEAVIPASENTRGRNPNINITINGGENMSRKSAGQYAVMIGREVNRALSRDN